jgi:hypothetical protein
MDKDDLLADIPQVDDIVMDTTAGLFCPFCKWGDEEAGPRKREHKYCRPDSLKRHARSQQLTERAVGEGFDYPYEQCTAFLGTAMHFLSHAERHHGHRL